MIAQKFAGRWIALVVTVLTLSACGGGTDEIVPANGNVSVSITVSQLPDTLTINRDTIEIADQSKGWVEYEWGVSFDLNGDGKINTGDISLTLGHTVDYDSQRKEEIRAVKDLEVHAWLFLTDLSQQLIEDVAPEEIVVNGNTITLTFAKADFMNLASMTTETKVRFRCAYWDDSVVADVNGSKLTYDYYKDASSTFANPDGIYLDDQGADDSNSLDPMIDMVQMNISVTE